MAHLQIGVELINQRGLLHEEHHDQESGMSGQIMAKSPLHVPAKQKQNSAQSTYEETRGFEIAGFPWQFVLVMGIIALGVAGFIIRLVIGF